MPSVLFLCAPALLASCALAAPTPGSAGATGSLSGEGVYDSGSASGTGSAGRDPAAQQYSVLMIAVDDLRPVGELLGEPEVQVPALSKLAASRGGAGARTQR